MANKDNLRFYEALRKVPTTAIKRIGAGRLTGMSDINPVFRIKTMTDTFGPCGIGWKYEITKQWQEAHGQEVKAFTNINLYIKVDGEWSDPIPGTGGATIVEVNSKGLYVNDEGYKMSLTDALSVSMKALGVAADVYFEKDAFNSDNKYDQQQYQQPAQQQQGQQQTNYSQQTFEQAQAVSPAQYKLEIAACADEPQLMAIWQKYPQFQGVKEFRDAWLARRQQIGGK